MLEKSFSRLFPQRWLAICLWSMKAKATEA